MPCEQNPWTPWNDCTGNSFGITNEDLNAWNWNDPWGSMAGAVGDNLGDFFSNITGQDVGVDVSLGAGQQQGIMMVVGFVALFVMLK